MFCVGLLDFLHHLSARLLTFVRLIQIWYLANTSEEPIEWPNRGSTWWLFDNWQLLWESVTKYPKVLKCVVEFGKAFKKIGTDRGRNILICTKDGKNLRSCNATCMRRAWSRLCGRNAQLTYIKFHLIRWVPIALHLSILFMGKELRESHFLARTAAGLRLTHSLPINIHFSVK